VHCRQDVIQTGRDSFELDIERVGCVSPSGTAVSPPVFVSESVSGYSVLAGGVLGLRAKAGGVNRSRLFSLACISAQLWLSTLVVSE
jgi:hypothetical protein